MLSSNKLQFFKQRKILSILIFVFLILPIQVIAANDQIKENTREIIKYTVKDGDNLWRIIQKTTGYGDRWLKVANYNELSNPRVIHAGNIIKIPAPINLIGNGDFKSDDIGRIFFWDQPIKDPIGNNVVDKKWYIVNSQTNDSQPGWATSRIKFNDNNINKDGYGIKSISCSKCDTIRNSTIIQIIPAEENNVYRLQASGFIKGDEENIGSIYLDFLDNQKRSIKEYKKDGFKIETWTIQNLITTAPFKTKYARVMLVSKDNVKGITYWDDIVLENLSSY